jgi:predicted ATPase/class 3 adenylate cyclase
VAATDIDRAGLLAGAEGDPTGLTFLFTDIEGSTRLLDALGDGYGPVLLEHRRLVRGALAEFHGEEQGTEGDSFFAIFRTADDAIGAAAQIQRALAAHDWDDHPVRVRIGVHSGHAARVGEGYVGLDIHRAARIMAAAHGGQVLVSDAAMHAAGTLRGALQVRDLGRHRLKDVGVERLWQLDGPGLPTGPFGPPRSLEAHPSNLPAELTPIFGREDDAARVVELVGGGSLVTITGPGGIGKSRLAVHAGHRLLESLPDGAFYLDVAAIDGIEHAVAELSGALGIRTSGDDARAALRDQLRGRDLLVIVDTADRLAATGGLIADIAAACPRVRFLVTARTPLHLTIEREYPLDTLPPTAAVELFVDRARAVRPGFTLDDASAAIVADIGARLDRLPLAIELAAARIRLFPPAALRDRLSRRLPLLIGGGLDRPDRQRTLHDTIAWSYDLLPEPERAVFQRLGVFADSFDLEDAGAVATPTGASPDMTIAALEQLVDRSLVAATTSDDEARFRLLGTIREFALETLRAGGEEVAAREAHAGHALDVARRELQALGSRDDLAAIAAVERAEPDLRAALEWWLGEHGAADPDRAIHGLELAAALGRFWWQRGHVHEGSAWLERAIAAAPGGPPATRATALFWSGVLFDDLRQPSVAAERLEASLALRRELGDETGVTRALNSLGAVARSLGDFDRAEALIGESLRRGRDARDGSAMASATSNLAVVAYERGDLARAVVLAEEARALDEAGGSRGAIASSTLNLGTLLIEAGRDADGIAAIGSVMPDLVEIGDPELVIGALEAVAGARTGAPDNAIRLLYAARALRDREHLPPRPSEEAAIDAVERRVGPQVSEAVRTAARAEATTVDLSAGLAMLSAAVGLPVAGLPLHPATASAGSP